MILPPQVKRQLTALERQPGGSYLLVGPAGVGKYTAVLELAQRLKVASAALITVQPEGSSIGIAQVHQLAQELGLKSSYGSHRFVIFRDADQMTPEAQNAFLKLLEEPPLDTTIFLLASNRSLLLPTVTSRCHNIAFSPVAEATIAEYLLTQFAINAKVARQIAGLSNGSVGRAVELATDQEALDAVLGRQQLIAKLADGNLDLYQKLMQVSQAEGEAEALAVLNSYLEEVRRNLRAAINKQDRSKIMPLAKQLKLATKLIKNLQAHANTRMVLTQLALEAISE